jgi:predicted tellurium resistance membrane protein TerC
VFDWVSRPDAWIGLLTLTGLEIILGIDNIVFISILASKLKSKEDQEKARKLGLLVALVSRLLLVLSASWIVSLKEPIFTIEALEKYNHHAAEVSWRDVILIVGGLFLIYKAVKEIHHKLEGQEDGHEAKAAPSLTAVLGQIFLLDVVFSIDSVITAVGMVKEVPIMMIAVLLAVGFMLIYSGPISAFVHRHPTVKVLALAFLIMIGTSLLGEGTGMEIPKGYIYFSMAFAIAVEAINLRVRAHQTPPSSPVVGTESGASSSSD